MFTQQEKESAKTINNYTTITNSHVTAGAIGNLDHSPTVQITGNIEVCQGDFDSLKKHLLDLGLSDDDVQSLQQSLRVDEENNQKGIGPRVLAWLSDLGSKVMTKATVTLATRAILKFFGLAS